MAGTQATSPAALKNHARPCPGGEKGCFADYPHSCFFFRGEDHSFLVPVSNSDRSAIPYRLILLELEIPSAHNGIGDHNILTRCHRECPLEDGVRPAF